MTPPGKSKSRIHCPRYGGVFHGVVYPLDASGGAGCHGEGADPDYGMKNQMPPADRRSTSACLRGGGGPHAKTGRALAFLEIPSCCESVGGRWTRSSRTPSSGSSGIDVTRGGVSL